MSFRRLSNWPLLLVVGLGTDDYLAEWHGAVRDTLAELVAFAAFTSLACWLLWRAMRR